jgi:hypothetical protein
MSSDAIPRPGASQIGSSIGNAVSEIGSTWTFPKWRFNVSNETKIIFGVTVAALLLGLVLQALVGGSSGNSLVWYVGTAVGVILAVLTFTIAFYGNRSQEERKLRYAEFLDHFHEKGRARESALMIWNQEGVGVSASLGPSVAREVARQLAIRTKALERECDIVIASPGKTMFECLPNVEFRFAVGGMQRLVGFLGDSDILTIDRPGDKPAGARPANYTMRQLADLRRLHLEPGPHRIGLKLPWGSWFQVIDVPTNQLTTFSFPETIGIVPLRNLWRKDWPEAQKTIIRGSKVSFESEPGRKEKMEGVGFAAFPGVDMMIEQGWKLRIEPYSDTTDLDWDLLVTTGRLDGISSRRLAELCRGQPINNPTSSIFAVAVAYAAYNARALDDLTAILQRLPDFAARTLDAYLLHLELARLMGTSLGKERLEIVESLIGESELVPIFRWGIPLLFRHGSRHIEKFRLVAKNISRASIWTAWHVPEPKGDKISVIVPNVEGLNIEQAREELRRTQLKMGSVSIPLEHLKLEVLYAFSDKPSGTVLSQVPPPARMGPRDTITLTISK